MISVSYCKSIRLVRIKESHIRFFMLANMIPSVIYFASLLNVAGNVGKEGL